MFHSVFVVPVLDRWILYAPLHHFIASVNGAAVRSVKGDLFIEHSGQTAEILDLLQSQPSHIPEPKTGEINPGFLGLIPTRACNIQCRYCGFGASDAGNDYMSPEIAVSAIDWMAKQAVKCGKKTLDVHFFGGEPFTAPELIDVAVHRTRSIANECGLTSRFEVATNGVFSKERARFVGDYFDTVVLSIDGPPEIHDFQRPRKNGLGSFEATAATARTLRNAPCKMCFRSCITQNSVELMEEIAGWLCKTFSPSSITFEILQQTPQSEAAGLKAPNPYRFASNYYRAKRVTEKYGVTPIYAASLIELQRLSFCPVGNDTVIVSPDGRLSACYLLAGEWKARGMDLDIGFLSKGEMNLDVDKIFHLRKTASEKPRCDRCFCRWSCAGGCHVNQTYPGCGDEYNDYCIQTRLITAFELIEKLENEPLIESLIQDEKAMERLALNESDRIVDWVG